MKDKLTPEGEDLWTEEDDRHLVQVCVEYVLEAMNLIKVKSGKHLKIVHRSKDVK